MLKTATALSRLLKKLNEICTLMGHQQRMDPIALGGLESLGVILPELTGARPSMTWRS